MRHLAQHLDSRVTNMIASLPVSLKPFFLMVTMLGDPIVTVLIGAFVCVYGYLDSNVRLALVGVTIWVVIGIGGALKLIFGRERPLTEYVLNMHFQTLSFPSGHATGATIAYGALAYIAWHSLPQPWNFIAVLLSIVVIFLVGVSRIYLGAHFPSDIIAGWMLGAVGILFIIFILRPFA